MTVSVKGSQMSDTGTSLVVKAGTSITFSAGLASLTLSASGIVELSGMMITINGETAVNIAAGRRAHQGADCHSAVVARRATARARRN